MQDFDSRSSAQEGGSSENLGSIPPVIYQRALWSPKPNSPVTRFWRVDTVDRLVGGLAKHAA
jgi:hypothetical protein